MQELITLIVQSLVKQPEAVSVTMEVRDQVEVYEIRVAPDDMGKVRWRKRFALWLKQRLLKRTRRYPLILSKRVVTWKK